MSTRRSGPQPMQQLQPQLSISYGEPEKKQRSKCMSFVCCMWKVFTCIFSHVTLVATVVAYCFLGAFTFEHLEAENERNVKQGISSIRVNLTDAIWKMTNDRPVLHQQNWTSAAIMHLQSFEKEILTAMKKDGWDGNEDVNQIQWTFFGALFYSIIVITTIGYGHIAPKTYMGKISTIFYAILGIPLMLLCLSNIGDIMASSFRFLYWRVCCYVCTREPKRSTARRGRSSRGTIRQGRSSMRSGQGLGTNLRRSVRNSQRSADSGFDPYYEPGLSHSYSESDCRYNTNMEDPYYPDNDRGMRQQGNLMPPSKYDAQGSGGMRQKMRGPPNPEVFMTDDYPSGHQQMIRSPPQSRADSMRLETHPQRSVQKPRQNDALYRKSPGTRAQSLDRRAFRQDSHMIDMDDESPCKTPILCNKYAIDDVDEIGRQTRPNPRSQSMPRQARYGDSLMPDRMPYYTEDNELADMQTVRKSAPRRREPRPVPAPSPRIMSPMGFAVHRQARHLQNVMDDNSIYDDEWDMHSGELPPPSIVRPVPIWLCVFLVVSYIIAGAFMFSEWEEWSFLDSAYFCFITLTTIGFGDFVPAQGVKNDSEISIALCSLYLLFGIALLAMSFNLVQEEVISNVKSVARRLGILKEEEMDD
uniref:Potassium channel domain-containing protein n=1 Tax=Anopheles atroparvus TaxID=41427 RepID=A0AAG5D1E0_ANOAO